MIYTGKVIPSRMDEPIKKDMLDFLISYKPQNVIVPEDEEKQKELKTRVLRGVISGEMSALGRKNENLISRDCLLLDLDDVILSAEELKAEIFRKFKPFDYALFPSVSNGVKGVRYRLALPLNKNVQREEYSLLVRFFNEKVLQRVIKTPDDSNATWSQIQLLPVLTQYNKKEDIFIHRTGKKLPVEKLLNAAKVFFKIEQEQTENETKIFKNKLSVKSGSYLNNMLAEIFKGCELGNRNNRVKELTVKFYRQGVKPSLILEIAKVANSYFLTPLKNDEVEGTVKSVLMTLLGVRDK